MRSSIRIVAGAVLCSLLACFVWWWKSRDPAVVIPIVDLDGTTSAVKRMIESARADVTTDPRSGAAWGRFGMVLSAHEFTPEATECFQNATRLDPAEFRWPYLLAIALEATNPETSARAYREAIARAPREVLPQIRLAELQQQQGEFDAATSLLENLKVIAPDNARIHFRLAQLLFQQQRLEDAFNSLTTARSLAPRNRMIAELMMQVGHARRLSGVSLDGRAPVDLKEANETRWADAILEQVQSLRRDAYWNALHAKALMESGQHAAAISELEQAITAVPDDWTLRTQLIRACLQVKEWERADRVLNQSIDQFPHVAELFRLRGTVRLMRNEWGLAVQDYRQAIALKPDDAAAYADLGFCLQQLGEMGDARQAFTEALRLDSSLEGARIQFARLLIETKNFEQARQTVETLLKANPDHPVARRIWEQAGGEK